MNAETFIAAMQRLFPSIYLGRERCIDGILTASGSAWSKNGYLYQTWKIKNFDKMIDLVEIGKVKPVKHYLEKYHLKHCKNNQEKLQYHLECGHELANHPMEYRLNSLSKYGVLWKIPDNATPDWLSIVVEYLNCVLASKIDFDEKSVLMPKERKSHFPDKVQIAEQLSRTQEIAEDIIREIFKKEGKEYIPLTEEQKHKNQEEWEKFYSPRARAERANNSNKESKLVAVEILEELKQRKFI